MLATDSNRTTMSDMQDFRALIVKRLEQVGWSSYRLAEACHAKGVHRDLVYRYLREDVKSVSSDTLATIFDVLGMKVTNGAKPKKLPKRSK